MNHHLEALLFFILSISVVFSETATSKIEVASRSISSLIDNLNQQHFIHDITLIYEDNDRYLATLAGKIVQLTSTPIAMKKLKINKNKFNPIWGSSYIYLVKSEIFDLQYRFPQRQIYTAKSVQIIYFKNSKFGMKFHKSVNDEHMPHVYYLLHSNDSSMEIYNLEFNQNCHYNWTSVNSFNSKAMKWNTSSLIREVKDFYNCKIEIGIKELSESNISIMKLLSKKYNFGAHLKQSHDSQLCKGSSICMGNKFQHFRITPNTFQTFPLHYGHMTFAVSHGPTHTPFEKLLLPFDEATWSMVIITFIIGFLSIIIIYRLPKYVQNFVFGINNRDPALALTQIFFGIGFVRTPNRNFARFLFMSFTLYCLIIRTAYQGKMFDFLQSNAEKWTPETIQDLIDKKIPIICLNIYDHSLNLLSDNS
jgi:hypothetical protein